MLLGGGGSITEALPGVGVQGGKSIHLRVTEEQRGKGNIGEQGKYGEQWNRYHLPSLASSVVCKVLISA